MNEDRFINGIPLMAFATFLKEILTRYLNLRLIHCSEFGLYHYESKLVSNKLSTLEDDLLLCFTAATVFCKSTSEIIVIASRIFPLYQMTMQVSLSKKIPHFSSIKFNCHQHTRDLHNHVWLSSSPSLQLYITGSNKKQSDIRSINLSNR